MGRVLPSRGGGGGGSRSLSSCFQCRRPQSCLPGPPGPPGPRARCAPSRPAGPLPRLGPGEGGAVTEREPGSPAPSPARSSVPRVLSARDPHLKTSLEPPSQAASRSGHPMESAFPGSASPKCQIPRSVQPLDVLSQATSFPPTSRVVPGSLILASPWTIPPAQPAHGSSSPGDPQLPLPRQPLEHHSPFPPPHNITVIPQLQPVPKRSMQASTQITYPSQPHHLEG